jgi:hypothetical protein
MPMTVNGTGVSPPHSAAMRARTERVATSIAASASADSSRTVSSTTPRPDEVTTADADELLSR